MTKLLRRAACAVALLLMLALPCVRPARVNAFARGVEGDDEGYNFRILRRLNAHGDEYMALALSADETRLCVGTERGEVLVWDVAGTRVARRLAQGAPVHAVVALADPRFVVAAGGGHHSAARTSVIRKWDVTAGTSQAWEGVGDESFFLLAADARAGIVAAATVRSHVAAWDVDGRRVALWKLAGTPAALAVAGTRVYVTLADAAALARGGGELQPSDILVFDAAAPQRAPRKLRDAPRRFWTGLSAAPGGGALSASYYDAESSERRIAVLDAESGAERGTLRGAFAAWLAPERFVAFGEHPLACVRLESGGAKLAVEEFSEPGGWHGAGEPDDLTGAVVSRDGRRAWGAFRLNAALAEWDLRAEDRRAKVLHHAPGLVYAMDVLETGAGGGLVATGGDDGFVRVWNLADFAPRREFRVPVGVPQGVGLLGDGRRVVYSYGEGAGREEGEGRGDTGVHVTPEKPKATPTPAGRTEIVVADLADGAARKLLTIPEAAVSVAAAGDAFVYNHGERLVLASAASGAALREFKLAGYVDQYALSPDRRWLAAADAAGKLYLFELATGRRVNTSASKIDSLTCIAAADDGRHVYTSEFRATVRRWDARADSSAEVAGHRGQCRSLRLSADGRRFVVGGNHRDVTIYDARSGQAVGHYDTDAADFYVTQAWLKGDRFFYATDAGVILDGILEREK